MHTTTKTINRCLVVWGCCNFLNWYINNCNRAPVRRAICSYVWLKLWQGSMQNTLKMISERLTDEDCQGNGFCVLVVRYREYNIQYIYSQYETYHYLTFSASVFYFKTFLRPMKIPLTYAPLPWHSGQFLLGICVCMYLPCINFLKHNLFADLQTECKYFLSQSAIVSV